MSDARGGAERAGRFDGRVALVTGGSTGIGAAIVSRFAAEGAKVAFCSRTSTSGEALESRLRDGGGMATFFVADVSREGDVRSLVDAVVATYGAIDIVVNAAGVTADGPVTDFAVAEWHRVFENNVTSTFLTCKHAAPHLFASTFASVVNLGSTYGFIGVPDGAAYAATKAAVISLTRTLALEWADRGVRVNALCPGATDTMMMDAWLATQADRDTAMVSLRDKHPLGRVATADDQAGAALFLASEDAAYVTGHALMVDGGFSVR